MYVIQRVKTATGPDGNPVGEPKTHYAVTVAVAGNVTEWCKDRARAVQVDDATALRVEDFYAGKELAGQPVGKVTAVDVVPVAPPVTRPDLDAE